VTLPREVDSIPLISSPVADDQKSPVRVELDNQRLLVMVSTVKLHASIPSLSFVSSVVIGMWLALLVLLFLQYLVQAHSSRPSALDASWTSLSN